MTVYNLLKSLGIETPTLKDKNAIGVLVAKKAKEDNITFTRVKQQEDNWLGWVNDYEEGFTETMKQVFFQFHEDNLKALANKVREIIKREEPKPAIKTPAVKKERKRIPVKAKK